MRDMYRFFKSWYNTIARRERDSRERKKRGIKKAKKVKKSTEALRATTRRLEASEESMLIG